MDFISQYLLANSGTVVPARYTRWSALAILAMTLGRRISIDHQHYKIYPGFYICLVGDPASRKTTAMNQARAMFLDCFPDYPTGVSITSREDVVKFMCSDECKRVYFDEEGAEIEWRPLANFVDELSNFMSFNPQGMIEFLTGVYDQPFYVSSTVKRGKEYILHPFFSLLACTTPNYIIGTFKASVIGGGFSRRIIFVYETNLPDRITFPVKTKEAYEAEEWCKNHLKNKVGKLVGPVKWTDEAKETLDSWYKKTERVRDNVLAGYYEAKDVLVQKVAMCLLACQEEPKLILTPDIIQIAIAFLEANEDNLPKLTIAAGRNPIAVYQHRLTELLDSGGFMPEFEFHNIASKDLNEMEYANVKNLLKSTKKIIELPLNLGEGLMTYVFSPKGYLEMKRKGLVK